MAWKWGTKETNDDDDGIRVLCFPQLFLAINFSRRSIHGLQRSGVTSHTRNKNRQDTRERSRAYHRTTKPFNHIYLIFENLVPSSISKMAATLIGRALTDLWIDFRNLFFQFSIFLGDCDYDFEERALSFYESFSNFISPITKEMATDAKADTVAAAVVLVAHLHISWRNVGQREKKKRCREWTHLWLAVGFCPSFSWNVVCCVHKTEGPKRRENIFWMGTIKKEKSKSKKEREISI